MKDSEAVEILLSKCENIKSHWDEHLEFWSGDEPGNYNNINVVAHYVVDQYSEGNTDDFEAIFNAVENLLESPSDSLKSLIVVGLLEDVQNIASHQDFGYSPFVQWLGVNTLNAWNQVIAFWEGK